MISRLNMLPQITPHAPTTPPIPLTVLNVQSTVFSKKCIFLQYCNTSFQQKYIIKFATDGAVLTKTKNAVQGTMKVIPCDGNGKVLLDCNVYRELDKEITLYYFIGQYPVEFLQFTKNDHLLFVANCASGGKTLTTQNNANNS